MEANKLKLTQNETILRKKPINNILNTDWEKSGQQRLIEILTTADLKKLASLKESVGD